MKLRSKKQNGFSILAIILVIVAVIIAIGVWALSGQTNTSSSGNSTSDIQATSIVNDGAAIKLAFDTLVVNGSVPASILFMPNTASTLTAPNMLDPANGIQYPKVNKNAIRDGATEPDGLWIYTPNFIPAPGIGSGTNPTNGILITGIKDTVCQRINFNLYASNTIPTKAGTLASFNTGATSTNPNIAGPVGIGAIGTALRGWTHGCFKASTTSVDSNIYYRTLYIK